MEYKTKAQKKKFYESMEWRRLREKIKQRDNWECVWCKKEGKVTTREHSILEVDHIKELETHPELALKPSNLRTLCRYHHNVRHNRFDGKKDTKKKWVDERW